MDYQPTADAVTVVIEKLSELVAQNNTETANEDISKDLTAPLSEELGDSETKETIDTAKHLIEFVKNESPSIVISRTPVKSQVGQSPTLETISSENKTPENTEKSTRNEEIIVNLPANLGQLNLTNKKTLIESLMSLNASLQQNSPTKSPTASTSGNREANKEIYKCEKCDYSSHNKYYLKQHVELVHNAERPFKCPFCDYAGKRSHSLKEHLVVHSTNRPYECHLCNATFRKKGHLTNHIKMHSNAKIFECNLCKDKFGDRYLLYDHLRSAHQNNDFYACDFCEYATTIKSNIVMHMHTHGNPKSYKCDLCPFIALHINIMKEHAISTHGNGATFHEESVTRKTKPVILLKCSECGFTTDEKSVLHDHMFTHIDSSSTSTGADPQSSSSHDKSQTKSDQSTAYMCKECDFSSTEAYTFITHMLSHRAKQGQSQVILKNTPVTATQAASTETQSTRVADPPQQWTHDESVGLYRCIICGYVTKHQRTIKSHIWKHSGHQDVDYPIFQNGPLSVYDDVPVGQTTLLSINPIVQMHKTEAPGDPEVDGAKKAVETNKSKVAGLTKIPIATEPGTLQKPGLAASAKQKRQSSDTQNKRGKTLVSPKAVKITIPPLAAKSPHMNPVLAGRTLVPIESPRPGGPLTIVLPNAKSAQQYASNANILQVTGDALPGDREYKGRPNPVIVPRSAALIATPENSSSRNDQLQNVIPSQQVVRRASVETTSPSIQKRPTSLLLVPRRNSTSAVSSNVTAENSGQEKALILESNEEMVAETRVVDATDTPDELKKIQENVREPGNIKIIGQIENELVFEHVIVENPSETQTALMVDQKDALTENPLPQISTPTTDIDKEDEKKNIKKRKLDLSPTENKDIEVSPKRLCIDEPAKKDINVVVEKVTQVFPTQPFAISESRGSSPRIPNSPRVVDVAVSDSSYDSDSAAMPVVTSGVTVVETSPPEPSTSAGPELPGSMVRTILFFKVGVRYLYH